MSPSIPVATPDLSTVPPWRVFLRSADHRLIRAGLGSLLGLAVARYLGPSDYGILSSALAAAAILLAFSTLGLDRLVRQEVENRPAESSTILGTAMGLRLVAAALAYLGLLFVAPSAHPGMRMVWLVASLALFSQIPLTVECWLGAKKQTRPCTLALDVGFGLAALLNLAFIWNGVSAVWFAAVMVLEAPLAALLIFHTYGKLAPNEDTFDWSTSLARRWLRQCWRTVGTTVLAVALLQLNVVLLAWLRGPVEAGRYGAASRIFELALFAAAAVSTVLAKRIHEGLGGRQLAPGDAAPLYRRCARIAWGIALLAAATAPWTAPLLLGDGYTGSALTFGILGFALVPQALASAGTSLGLNPGDERRMLRCAGAGVALNLLLGPWWIAVWGAPGAAAAAIVSLSAAWLVLPLFQSESRDFARAQLRSALLADLFGRKSGTAVPIAPAAPVPPQPPLPPPSAPVST